MASPSAVCKPVSARSQHTSLKLTTSTCKPSAQLPSARFVTSGRSACSTRSDGSSSLKFGVTNSTPVPRRSIVCSAGMLVTMPASRKRIRGLPLRSRMVVLGQPTSGT